MTSLTAEPTHVTERGQYGRKTLRLCPPMELLFVNSGRTLLYHSGAEMFLYFYFLVIDVCPTVGASSDFLVLLGSPSQVAVTRSPEVLPSLTGSAR